MDFKEVRSGGGKSHVCRWQIKFSPVMGCHLPLTTCHLLPSSGQSRISLKRIKSQGELVNNLRLEVVGFDPGTTLPTDHHG